LGIDSVDAEHELSVLGIGRVVNLLTESVGSHLLVFFKGAFVQVIEIHQSVTLELLVGAKVLSHFAVILV